MRRVRTSRDVHPAEAECLRCIGAGGIIGRVVQDLIFNLLMLGVDTIALLAWRRHPRGTTLLAALAVAGAVVPLLAAGVARSSFGAMRLLAWAIFVHGPIGLSAASVLTFRTQRAMAAVCATTAVVLGAIGVDAFLIEPYRLEVSEVEVRGTGLRRPLRMAVVADLQTDVMGDHERQALRAVMDQDPDLLLLAGDYIHEDDPARRARLRDELRAALREVGFGAPLGAFAVGGNCDPSDWPAIFEGFPVTAVVETASFDLGEDLRVTALGVNDARRGVRLAATDRFHVVLGHYPDFAIGDVSADLLVAGHTHGGQVQLPGIGPLLTLSRVPRSWASGVTDLGRGRTLVVSRGIGMERGEAPRLRFLCPPEIVVIDAAPADR